MEKLTEQAFKKKIRNFITLNSVTKDEIRQEFNEIFDKLKEFENADVVPRSEVEQAKQEVAREMLTQIKDHINFLRKTYDKPELHPVVSEFKRGVGSMLNYFEELNFMMGKKHTGE